MIRSMTGFGAATESADGLSVRVEVRSVNHKHIQLKTRIPTEFAHLEARVDAVLRKQLQRGAVSATISVARLDAASHVSIDRAAAERYAKQLRALVTRLKLPGEVQLSDLIGLPGVLQAGADTAPSDKHDKLLLRVLASATKDLVGMRVIEGKAMVTDFEKNTRAIEATVTKIGKRAPKVVTQHQRALKRRVTELLGDASKVSSKDLARELALIADRLDINEELTRLASHVTQLRKTLDKGGAVGRRLDFLAQELFREANTIGSKASDAQIAHAVVDLKTYIERLREQVQNVE
ncbi:MAG: hypothetical protein ACI8QZ_001720 [Chlamydiales bacterium]